MPLNCAPVWTTPLAQKECQYHTLWNKDCSVLHLSHTQTSPAWVGFFSPQPSSWGEALRGLLLQGGQGWGLLPWAFRPHKNGNIAVLDVGDDEVPIAPKVARSVTKRKRNHRGVCTARPTERRGRSHRGILSLLILLSLCGSTGAGLGYPGVVPSSGFAALHRWLCLVGWGGGKRRPCAARLAGQSPPRGCREVHFRAGLAAECVAGPLLSSLARGSGACGARPAPFRRRVCILADGLF